MRSLLASTCLTSVMFMIAGSPAQAQRVIDGKVTTPVATSTSKDDVPADIKITDKGSVTPASGTAVTIDSNNSVTNAGLVQFNNVDDATGILVSGSRTGNITNSGDILVTESYTPKDEDEDGDPDGPLAKGSNRYGIRVAPGGTFQGKIVNSGKISVEGNDSAAIAVDGRLKGALTHSGRIEVLGDRSVGVRAADVTGNVRLTGQISVVGEDSIGVALDGDIGGSLAFQGSVSTTGYRSVSASADTSKYDEDDLLQGGPAVRIAGNVAGGVIFDAPPPDLDKEEDDEDDDGVADASEGTATITAFGAAPAVQIGAEARDLTIGAIAGRTDGHGLVVNGSIRGSGLFAGVDANGLLIGGSGGDVLVEGGLTVAGSVTAQSKDAAATAIRLGSGAKTDEMRISGEVAASSGGKEKSVAEAIVVENEASLSEIRNSGRIKAEAAKDGRAAAIVDRSGAVSLIENSGAISASGPEGVGRAVAIDLSANVNGATVRQTSVEQGVAPPSIAGDILFGAGDDLLEIDGGTVAATTRFGAGTNRMTLAGDSRYTGSALFGTGADRLTMSGTATFSGSVDFGGGADLLQISGDAVFDGSIAGSGELGVIVDKGSFAVSDLGAVGLSSLTLTGGGTLGVNIDAAKGTSTLYEIMGAARFDEGTNIQIELASIGGSEGRFLFLDAGELSGSDGISLTDESLPYLFKGAIEADEAKGELAVVIERKKASDIGLNGSETRAYEAVMDALDKDAAVADAFLAVANGDAFRSAFRQMLPDHAGGAFDTVTQGSRASARFLMDPAPPHATGERWGLWVQQIAWGSSKDLGDTAAYDISGWGTSGGAEILAGDAGSFGLTLAYLTGRDEDGETDNQVRSDQIELAAHWRGQWGGLQAHARASAATIGFDGKRRFTASINDNVVTREAEGSWDGRLYSAAAGFSYDISLGRFSLRPIAAIDYYRLDEDGYSETGGGDAFNLIVDERESDELAATASLALGMNFGSMAQDAYWVRTELEGGRRTIVGGELGATTARIGDGDAFTLLPEARADGWVGRLRVVGGSAGFTVGGEFSVEEQQNEAAISARATIRMSL